MTRSESSHSTVEEPRYEGVGVEPPLEAQKAAQEILESRREKGEGWTDQSKIVRAYPIYLPGIEEPSYYEFKVKTGGEDSGYILVNVNKTDILVPEFSTEGLTLTETYEKGLGTQNFKVFRYGWLNSAAQSKDDPKAFLASIGFAGHGGQLVKYATSELEERSMVSYSSAGEMPSSAKELEQSQQLEPYHLQFEQAVSQEGVFPAYRSRNLQEYYQKLEESQASATTMSETTSSRLAATRRMEASADSSSVRNRLCYRFATDWHTPGWNQPERYMSALDANCPVGCGNTAWAIVYGYWKQFKGKARLFRTDLSPFTQSGEPEAVMWRISEMTETMFGKFGWTGSNEYEYFGATLPSKMINGINYARERGYSEATVEKFNSGERTKFWEINEEIAADRPVILCIHVAPDIILPNHYIVVEKAEYIKQPGIDTYRYYVNMGWGSNPVDPVTNAPLPPHKWINTVRQGINDLAFSAYFIHMRDESAPKPFEIVVDNLKGRGTYCITPGQQQITFHLDNLKCDCDSASVQVFQDGVLLRTLSNLKEKENTVLPFGASGKQIILQSSCGSQQAQKAIVLDYNSPGFDGIDVFPSRNRERSVVLAARRIADDGYWLNRDYYVEVTLDGATTPNRRSGTSVTLDNLSIGRHSATMVIEDGCGRRSAPRSISFIVSDQPVTLSFITPSVNARVNRGRDLTITIQASAPDGVMRASVYLDRVSDNEFDCTRLCSFPGTFGAGRPERKTCTVRADWSRGRHELIAVAEGNSGQTSRVIRVFYVD